MARIKLRRDTAANWTTANPVLDLGEPGYVTDTRQLKFGNGVDTWANLPFFAGGFNGGQITTPLEITADGNVWGSALYLSGAVDRNPIDAGLIRVGNTLGFDDINLLATFVDVVDNYTQILLRNRSSGTSASSDFVVHNDIGAPVFGNFGINSSNYAGTGGPFDRASSTYLLSSGGELSLGTVDPHSVIIATNDTTRIEVANNGGVEFKPSANVHILNTTDSTAHDTGALVVEGGLGVGKNIVADQRLYLGVDAVSTTLTSPTMVIKQTGSSYIQAAMINSLGTGSSDWVAYGDNSTENEGWADFGFAGSTFNDPAYTITEPGDGYLFVQGRNNPSSSGSLILATGQYGSEKDIIFGTGGFSASNEKMRFSHSLGQLYVRTNVAATNTSTGAIRVDGGIGVSGSVYAGALYDSGNRVLTSATPINYTGDFKYSVQAADHGNWLLLESSTNRLVNRNTYAALFSLIGTTYGSGDGISTFGLPSQVQANNSNFISATTL